MDQLNKRNSETSQHLLAEKSKEARNGGYVRVGIEGKKGQG